MVRDVHRGGGAQGASCGSRSRPLLLSSQSRLPIPQLDWELRQLPVPIPTRGPLLTHTLLKGPIMIWPPRQIPSSGHCVWVVWHPPSCHLHGPILCSSVHVAVQVQEPPLLVLLHCHAIVRRYISEDKCWDFSALSPRRAGTPPFRVRKRHIPRPHIRVIPDVPATLALRYHKRMSRNLEQRSAERPSSPRDAVHVNSGQHPTCLLPRAMPHTVGIFRHSPAWKSLRCRPGALGCKKQFLLSKTRHQVPGGRRKERERESGSPLPHER